MHAALDRLPEAKARSHAAAGDIETTAQQRAWRVRAALRIGDWYAVREAIEAMPADEREAAD